MFVVLGGAEVEVVVNDPRATVGDLAAAAGLPVGALRGVRAEPGTPLVDAGVLNGSDLDRAAPRIVPSMPAVAVVGGLDAGRRAVGHLGPVLVGRAAEADLVVADASVSRRHALLGVGLDGRASIADLGSRNGSWCVGDDGTEAIASPTGALAFEQVVRLGAAEVAVVAPVDDTPRVSAGVPRGVTGTVPHNRPPRPALPPPTPPVSLPEPPATPGPALPLGVVAVVAPLALAAVMVVLLRDPVFALFALLAPVLAVGGHAEARRRATKGRRREAARWARDVDTLRTALRDAARNEVRRRRSLHADAAEVARRAEQPSTRLWERRPGHDDWLALRVGTGAVPWDVPLTGSTAARAHPDIDAAVAEVAVLGHCPVDVELAGGGVVGIVGPRPAALAIARAITVQAAVHHGPADLPVLVAASEEHAADWDWSKWLPHTAEADGGRRLTVGRVATDALADGLIEAARAERTGAGAPYELGPCRFVVADGDDLLAGRRAPLRRLLGGAGGSVAGIVLAATADRLPALCRAVVVLDGDDGDAAVLLPADGRRLGPLRATGVADATARATARALARFDDPELDGGASGLPAVVRLLMLLGLEDVSAATIRRRWRRAGPDPRPSVLLGLAADGPLEIDLVADGPHTLVAGTTGAGKSELLRTLVAGLAAGADPDHLTFVLVDFKGGSAFDACARLPHAVGLVTDLDAGLAERALRCLEAELRHRERALRAAGAADLTAYRWMRRREPLPRLVVVVDEFATLKAELPDFVDALVGIAQRGRSLGVHLVLATQRPAGAVSDHVRANANLRIALRVQDAGDSLDVVDVPDAAALPRSRPGRACVRLGPGEVVVAQTALVTAHEAAARAPVELRPFDTAARPLAADDRAPVATAPSDLDRLVDACAAAWAGHPPPRRPWPDPLPIRLDRDSLGPAADPDVVAVARADDPDAQEQRPTGWRLADGNLALFGARGSGTTTSLLAVAAALAVSRPPDALHLYALDHGEGALAALAALPHCGAVVTAGDGERTRRLLGHLRSELEARRALPAAERDARPAIVLLIDGIAGLLAGLDDLDGFDVVEDLERLLADGPPVGLRCALTAERAAGLRASLAGLVRSRWVHRLADPMDAGLLGVAGPLPDLPPGRYIDAVTGLAAQVALPSDGWPAAIGAIARRWPAPRPEAAAPAIGALPESVSWSDLATPCALGPSRPWTIPVGIAADGLEPIALALWPGDHVFVAGSPRSGRTTTLATIAHALAGTTPRPHIVVLDTRRSWLGATGIGERVASVADITSEAARDDRHRLLFVLVDDADAVDDADGGLAHLAASDRPDLHLVVAAAADAGRLRYDHWTRAVRRRRLGVLLRPDLDLDGDLLGAALPRRVPVPMVPGRGFVVADGVARLAQLAQPE